MLKARATAMNAGKASTRRIRYIMAMNTAARAMREYSRLFHARSAAPMCALTRNQPRPLFVRNARLRCEHASDAKKACRAHLRLLMANRFAHLAPHTSQSPVSVRIVNVKALDWRPCRQQGSKRRFASRAGTGIHMLHAAFVANTERWSTVRLMVVHCARRVSTIRTWPILVRTVASMCLGVGIHAAAAALITEHSIARYRSPLPSLAMSGWGRSGADLACGYMPKIPIVLNCCLLCELISDFLNSSIVPFHRPWT